jgi:hypothetical protein
MTEYNLLEECFRHALDGIEPKTDQQIYKAARDEWVGVLLQLWEAYGKQPDPKQLKVYVKQLGDIPLGTLETAIGEILRSHTYNSVPTIGEIWEVIYGTEKNPKYPDAYSKAYAYRLMGDGVLSEVVA